MENASKALIMAGSILITLIIIGLVVLLFSQLANIQREADSSLTAKQLEEFNRKFELYNTNLYGSELLSLANLIKDYEQRQEVIEDSNRIVVKVKFDESCCDQLGAGFRKNKAYDLVTEVLPKYQTRNEKDKALVTFKRIGFKKEKVEYSGLGRISYLEFIGQGLSETQQKDLKDILDKL